MQWVGIIFLIIIGLSMLSKATLITLGFFCFLAIAAVVYIMFYPSIRARRERKREKWAEAAKRRDYERRVEIEHQEMAQQQQIELDRQRQYQHAQEQAQRDEAARKAAAVEAIKVGDDGVTNIAIKIAAEFRNSRP